MKPVVASLFLLLAACSAPVAEQTATPAPAASGPPAPAASVAPAAPVLAMSMSGGDPVEGRRVAWRVGCMGCHGEKLQGDKLWGKEKLFQVFSANITEKRELYDDAAFERLLRTGTTHDGHRALGMPVVMLQYLSDREVRDVIAFVRSVPHAPNPGLQASWFTAEERRKQEEYGDDRGDPLAVGAPPVPPAGGIDRGRHLVMTTCVECHGPKLDGWDGDTPNLIVAKGYSSAQFHRLARTGIVAAGTTSKTGLMTSVGKYRMGNGMTDAEVADVKAFLDNR